MAAAVVAVGPGYTGKPADPLGAGIEVEAEAGVEVGAAAAFRRRTDRSAEPAAVLVAAEHVARPHTGTPAVPAGTPVAAEVGVGAGAAARATQEPECHSEHTAVDPGTTLAAAVGHTAARGTESARMAAAGTLAERFARVELVAAGAGAGVGVIELEPGLGLGTQHRRRDREFGRRRFGSIHRSRWQHGCLSVDGCMLQVLVVRIRTRPLVNKVRWC